MQVPNDENEVPVNVLDEGYSLVDKILGGGQSITLVLKKGDVKFLLKKPNKKSLSKEQKFRFEQEAKALEMMDGAGTPKVFSYNFIDNPYILMEYIEGDTLSNLVTSKNRFSLEYSVDVIFRILEIIKKVHEIGLLHRDIKPDNIIISDNGDIYLIDFGLCRISNDDVTFKTPSSTELGNRFLRLPELGKGEKIPSSVSDITFVVGILFFMIYGHSPNQLLDENGKAPHKRDFMEIAPWLKYTFDKGFAYDISQRFQDVDELKNFIVDQKNNENKTTQNNPIEEFSKLINDGDFRRKDDILKMMTEAHTEFIVGVNSILSPELVTGGSGPNIQKDQYSILTDFFIVRSGHSQPLSPYRLISTLNRDLSSISYYSDVAGFSTKNGTYSTGEKDRIINEYRDLGKDRAAEAVRNLIKMIKENN